MRFLDAMYKVRLFTLSGLLAGVCGLFLGLEASAWVLRHGSYWLLLAGFAIWLLSMAPVLRANPECWQLSKLEFIYALGGALLLLLMQPSGYKVVMDEPLLVASSKQLHLDKQYYVPGRAYELGGAYYHFDGYVDKRPGFFPFLLSVLHDLTGFRSHQGFLLNGALGLALIYLSALIGRSLWPQAGAWAGPLLVLNVPLFAVLVNSSGFDLLNAVCLLLVLRLAMSYAQEPSVVAATPLLWASVLLANTRYESLLYCGLAALILLMVSHRSGAIHWPSKYWLLPWCLLPVVLHIRLSMQRPDAWQLREGDAAAFSLEHIAPNLGSFMEFTFSLSGRYPNSILLPIVLILTSGLIAYRYVQSKEIFSREMTDRSWLVVLLGLFVILNFLVLLAYHWGELTDPAATRLSAPIILLQILLILMFCGKLFRTKRTASLFLMIPLFGLLGQSLPACWNNAYPNDYPAAKWANWVKSKALEYQDAAVLLVTQPRLAAVVENVSAISLGRAIRGKAELALHQELRTFNEIYFIHLQVADDAVEGGYREDIPLETHFNLEAIEQFDLDSERRVQLSRLKEVRFSPDEVRLPVELLEGKNLRMDWFQVMPALLP